MFPARRNQNKKIEEVAILISDKIDFKNCSEKQEGHYIMMKRSTH